MLIDLRHGKARHDDQEDEEVEIEEFRGGIWRLNVVEAAKGRGVGRFAVEQVREEARRRGYEKITVLWDPAEDGPERFYLRVGFEKTGELFGETVGTLKV
ncbi:GNAT family N-acetyltransferase [Microbacterium sp. Sa1CUA4]|uniref:GNAT family N-acetyltransferase n=1 Tax=Microbacterium gallinarum TaxID=2762209 RepID=A0ABR8X4L8_9MICO|nr:GNAT family N-acetyltransferase [Microbacterium gallinarum]